MLCGVLRLTLGNPGRAAAGGSDPGRADAAAHSGVDTAAEDVNRLLTTFAGSS
jgi:hypothetical protein